MENRDNNKRMAALPAWEDDRAAMSLNTNMRTHAPFVMTQYQSRSDLGYCIISTWAPHVVCKVHTFQTHPAREVEASGYTDPKYDKLKKNEQERFAWLQQRRLAFRNGEEALRRGMTVRGLMESRGHVYDEELDEPRVVCKVPGLNVYLELYGLLDNVQGDDIDWESQHGIYKTLEYMSLWAVNSFEERDRQRFRSHNDDYQPLPEWHDAYNRDFRPWMSKKIGIGLTYIDPSRRADYMHTHISNPRNGEVGMIRELKRENVRLAEQGEHPEEYGK